MTRSQEAGLIAGIAVIMFIALLWFVSLWGECRDDHSIMYCLKVLG